MIVDIIEKFPVRPEAIGGMTIGADPIVAGAITEAYRRGISLSGSIVRKEPKEHGTRKAIENEVRDGASFIVVDDVVTSGRSTIQACKAFEDHGYRVAGIIALVDRCQGGMDNIREQYPNAPITALFNAEEFPRLVKAQADGQRRIVAA
ncbi:MAG: orotate phosphoribosyltransferase [Gammaproteobacteria bacterium]